MDVVYHSGQSHRDTHVDAVRPAATVADLAEALGAPTRDLRFDGRTVAAEATLHESGLLAGAQVRPAIGARAGSAPSRPNTPYWPA